MVIYLDIGIKQMLISRIYWKFLVKIQTDYIFKVKKPSGNISKENLIYLSLLLCEC